MAEEIWKKLRGGIITTLAGELDKEIERICNEDISFCNDRLGIHIYNEGVEPWEDGRDLLFVLTRNDYRLMRRYNESNGYYHVDGVKFVESVIRTIAEETPLTHDEAAEILKKLAEDYPEWTARAIAYIAFLPRWVEEIKTSPTEDNPLAKAD
ncbi:MAG: hypothetical protein ACK4SY_10210, partial [Pyrobaculum sp.]